MGFSSDPVSKYPASKIRRRLETKSTPAATCRPSCSSSVGNRRNQPATRDAASTTSRAGPKRLILLAQNSFSVKVPDSMLVKTTEEMRKPDMTKKMSTPTNPPANSLGHA